MSFAGSVQIQKLGVQFQPATIYLFYTDLRTKKFRRRTVLLPDFTGKTDINEYAKGLHNNRVTKNYNLFRFVDLRRLERLLFVLKEGQTGKLTKEQIEEKLKRFDGIDENEDLNKLDDEELKHKKLIMNEVFEKNRVDPHSKDFVYDVVVDFEPTSEKNDLSDWDSEKETQPKIKVEPAKQQKEVYDYEGSDFESEKDEEIEDNIQINTTEQNEENDDDDQSDDLDDDDDDDDDFK